MKLVWEQLGISMFGSQPTNYGFGPIHRYLITPQMPTSVSWQAWYVGRPQSTELGVFASLEAAQEFCGTDFRARLEPQVH